MESYCCVQKTCYARQEFVFDVCIICLCRKYRYCRVEFWFTGFRLNNSGKLTHPNNDAVAYQADCWQNPAARQVDRWRKLHYNSDSGLLKKERCPNNSIKCKKKCITHVNDFPTKRIEGETAAYTQNAIWTCVWSAWACEIHRLIINTI